MSENNLAIYLTIFLIVAIVIGLFVLLRMQKPACRARTAARRGSLPDAKSPCPLGSLKDNPHFWGIELGQPGCAESYKLLGKQFPLDNAPELPVAGCGRKACTCKFKGLRERRMRPRRMHPDRRSEVRFDKTHPDRRRNAGRRRGDLWVGHSI